MINKENENWQLFQGDGKTDHNININEKFSEPPPWRKFINIDELEGIEKDEIEKRWKEIQKLAKLKENQRGIQRGKNFRIDVEKTSGKIQITEAGKQLLNAVNAAIYLRRPLLVTGNPGSGKTSLAYAIAYELNLGPVLTWGITGRSTLQDGLYRYDAIGRLQDSDKDGSENQDRSIGDYITLGALGTAFLPSPLPRVLLIDEIDKSDINLPNDLLHIFEEGAFRIPELVRRVKDTQNNNKAEKTEGNQQTKSTSKETDTQKTEENKKNKSTSEETDTEKVFTADGEIKATIVRGKVRCAQFPIVIMTSNGEREFPPAFLRRTLRVKMPDPKAEALKSIVKAHFGEDKFKETEAEISQLIKDFEQQKQQDGDRATDQLLNAVYLIANHISLEALDKDGLRNLLFKSLSVSEEL